jgi:hypothetical protein
MSHAFASPRELAAPVAENTSLPNSKASSDGCYTRKSADGKRRPLQVTTPWKTTAQENLIRSP